VETKSNVLFWIYGSFLHFSLAYYLQSQLNANFFGVIDINSKPKRFFQEQTLVKFQKTWFYHDHIKKIQREPDLQYLRSFEKSYNINLWKLAINERFFYLHNRFYKFTKHEILSILEQEIKLFESILDEVSPDYFLTYDPVFHHQKLLLDMCRIKGVKVLLVCSTGIDNKFIITENAATFDLDKNSRNNPPSDIKITSNNTKNDYDLIFQRHLQNRNFSTFDKFTALKDYLADSDKKLINSNFMYYGRTKLKVIKDALYFEIKQRRNYHFLKKHSSLSPDLKTRFIYFPMNIVEELNLLHYAPYYTNQIEVIRHIAKSIPINYVLYVKEHILAGLRGWNNIDYYKQILDIPNVVLINPHFDNNLLLKNAELIATIRGTASLKAIRYGKPAIVFGEQPIQIMPSIFSVGAPDSLPKLIRLALKHKTDSTDYEKYKEILNHRTFEFNQLEFENNRNKSFFSGGIFSNVVISNKEMTNFLNKNKSLLVNLMDAHLKIMLGQQNTP